MISAGQATFVGTLLIASIGHPNLFVSGHGHLISPRSRNFFAYEAGRDDTTNSPPGLPPREYCSHCLNAKRADATCGRGSAQSYDPIDGWLDTYGEPMPWTSQATYVEGQEVLMSIELTTNHAGHAEIRACPMDEGDAAATQECFDAHPLTFVRDVCYNGPVDTLYPVRGYFSNQVMHHFIYKLPPGLTGGKVLLQWRYIAANSCIPPGYKDEERLGLDERGWLRGMSMEDCNVNGEDPPQLVLDPTGARGAGDPEQFWNCAEVTVVPASTANPDPGPHPAGVDICETSNPPPTPPMGSTPTTPSPQVTSPGDTNTEGYCNWGPLGTGMSSTCDGCVQGGSSCNGGAHQCESDCGGKWCTNVEDISPTCSNSNDPPPPSPPSSSNSFYCGTSWMNAKESSCKPLSEGGGLKDTATPCANGNSTACAPSGYCYADINCSTVTSPPVTPPTNPPPTPTNPPQTVITPPPGTLVASTTRYWDCSGGGCGCAYLPGGPGTDANPAHCHSNALFSAPTGNEYGATYYGAAAISRFLWDGNTNSGDWRGEGCGKCWKVTGSGLTATTTTIVLKGTNICPTGICNENGKAHFDIAAPGFDVAEFSWSNTCEDLEPDELEGFTSCSRWRIDSQDPSVACDCSKFISPVLRAGCENFLAMQWDNPSVVYEEVSCPEEIANLPCWEENGNGYPQGGIPETCMDPNGDPNTILPFPGSPPITPPPTSVQPPTSTVSSPPTTPPPAPTPLDAIECPAGFETARWTWYISYPKCCEDQPHYDPNASTEECDVYNGCSWDGDFAYVGNRPFDYVQNTDIVAFFASNGETHPKKIIRVYSPGHDKSVDAIVLDTCGDSDCNGCCTENADTGGGYLVDMEENTVVRHFGSLNEASGLVCWQILPDEEYDAGGYCNWSGCNSEAQGGWDCNLNEYECETACSGTWCTGATPPPAPVADPITSPPVVPPTTPPATSPPVVPPTTPPVSNPTTGSPCCTWDLKNCSLDPWCNENETQCKSGCGAPFWDDVSACPLNGVAKGYDCLDNPCCPGLYCKEHSQWYHSCEVPPS